MTTNNTAVEATAAEPDWSAWLGRSESRGELVSANTAAALAATLDIDPPPGAGDPLPPGWHWIFFNPFVPRSGIGPDGHPKRGGFLPPITLPRRMWAGSRIAYPGTLIVGAEAIKTSVISKIQSKSGRAGNLVFVTVTHTTSSGGSDCIVEEQDIVYREPPQAGAPAPALTPAPTDAAWSEEVTPDPVLLFRFSALTANGHRIHYDQPYAKNEEGYPDLVVHGPLTATLLQNFAVAHAEGRRLSQFEFRGVHPLFVSAPFKLEGRMESGDRMNLWARGPSGELAMQASATLAPR